MEIRAQRADEADAVGRVINEAFADGGHVAEPTCCCSGRSAAVGYAEGGVIAREIGSWQTVSWALDRCGRPRHRDDPEPARRTLARVRLNSTGPNPSGYPEAAAPCRPLSTLPAERHIRIP